MNTCPCGDKARICTDLSYNPVPICQSCGFVQVDGEWKGVCKTCKQESDKLYGLFVPHLCKKCEQAEIKQQQESGRVCRLCRSVYLYCCC